MANRALLFLLCILTPSLLGAVLPAASPSPTTAEHDTIRVIDGDTLLIRGAVVQLAGIDAPELGQTCEHHGRRTHCGREAAYALKKMIVLAGPPVTCYPVAAKGGAPIASCVRGREDLSLAMLESGHAVAVTEGSALYIAAEAPLFLRAERTAREASLGIWGGAFKQPWQWRREKEAAGRAGFDDPACVVKGILGGGGARLYFGPLDDTYDDIAIDPKKGGRLFCSDDEARARAWRAPWLVAG